MNVDVWLWLSRIDAKVVVEVDHMGFFFVKYNLN